MLLVISMTKYQSVMKFVQHSYYDVLSQKKQDQYYKMFLFNLWSKSTYVIYTAALFYIQVLLSHISKQYDILQYRMGHAVAQLVEALRYKPEGRGFDSRWCHWNFSFPSGCTMVLGLTQPLTEMSTGIFPGGGKGSWCIGLTTLPPSCADYLEIWAPQPPGTLRACPAL